MTGPYRGVVDEVIAEPEGGAHNDPSQAAGALRYALQKHLNDLRAMRPNKLLDTRYERYRHLGVFEEDGVIHT
jgi:acetyl-CoA carboxylase carboxyl transferase subunit alpha